MRNIDDYDRVTDVLGSFSGLHEIDPGVLRNAADRGTVVHRICDALVKKEFVVDEWILDLVKGYCRNQEHVEKEYDQVKKLVSSFEKWMKEKFFYKTPDRFYDDELMITGECDLTYWKHCENNDSKLVLVDLKTPACESKTWLLQGSAYSYLAKKAGYEIEVIEFVKLSKTGGEAKIFTYEENFCLFKSVLDTYRYFYDGIKTENVLDYM